MCIYLAQSSDLMLFSPLLAATMYRVYRDKMRYGLLSNQFVYNIGFAFKFINLVSFQVNIFRPLDLADEFNLNLGNYDSRLFKDLLKGLLLNILIIFFIRSLNWLLSISKPICYEDLLDPSVAGNKSQINCEEQPREDFITELRRNNISKKPILFSFWNPVFIKEEPNDIESGKQVVATARNVM